MYSSQDKASLSESWWQATSSPEIVSHHTLDARTPWAGDPLGERCAGAAARAAGGGPNLVQPALLRRSSATLGTAATTRLTKIRLPSLWREKTGASRRGVGRRSLEEDVMKGVPPSVRRRGTLALANPLILRRRQPGRGEVQRGLLGDVQGPLTALSLIVASGTFRGALIGAYRPGASLGASLQGGGSPSETAFGRSAGAGGRGGARLQRERVCGKHDVQAQRRCRAGIRRACGRHADRSVRGRRCRPRRALVQLSK